MLNDFKFNLLDNNIMKLSKLFHTLTLCVLVLLIGGCATTQNPDPLETMNRGIYKFNTVVDDAVVKPVAKGYKAVAPSFVVKGINNFFNNLRDVITVINDLLQFKIKHAANDAGRVAINSTVGLLGFIDVHSMSGGERRKEDFGQTLGHWGVGSGAYLVIPFFGPSSIRDGVGLVADTLYFDPISYITDVRTRNQVRLAQFTDARTELLNASDILNEASIDPYAFQRDAYLQYRQGLVEDADGSTVDYSDENLLSDGFQPYSDDEIVSLAN
jgi:phospholipid-binding lipoprotein MlaA